MEPHSRQGQPQKALLSVDKEGRVSVKQGPAHFHPFCRKRFLTEASTLSSTKIKSSRLAPRAELHIQAVGLLQKADGEKRDQERRK